MKQLSRKQVKKFHKNHRKRKKHIVLVLENIQYAKNVASVFRTADAANANTIFLTGISHHPPFGKDLRKVSRNKERAVRWEYIKETGNVIDRLKKEGYYIIALEITDKAIPFTELPLELKDKNKVAFIAGSEVYGVTKKTLGMCHKSVYIPMYGKGASLNVSVSIGIILYSF